jgi:hypothetical protein
MRWHSREVDYEALIRGTFTDLETWRLRAHHEWLPDPNTELAADDEDWPWWRLSQLAVAGLAAGREHLSAVTYHLSRGEAFPFADRTLVRTAILGGAQAVWLLTPDDRPARVKRARTMAADVYSKHGVYLSDLSIVAGGEHSGTEVVKAHVEQRARQLQAVRDDAGQRGELQPTHVIEQAVREALGDEYVVEARTEWRRGSGAAHGLPWAVLGGPSTEQVGEPDEHGMATHVAGGGWEPIANGYMLAYQLLRRGWQLLERRGRDPG